MRLEISLDPTAEGEEDGPQLQVEGKALIEGPEGKERGGAALITECQRNNPHLCSPHLHLHLDLDPQLHLHLRLQDHQHLLQAES